MCPAANEPSPSILGISFDGLAISGIVNQFLDVAAVLRGEKFRVLCDLGYDITLGRTNDLGWEYLPEWVEPVRCIGRNHPPQYTPDIVLQAHADVVAGTPIAGNPAYAEVREQLTALLVDTFVRENVWLLVIENGTLPDNPLFTEALVGAITDYAARRGLGKYVLWRDHDLMWSAEPHFYGPYPYPGVRQPQADGLLGMATATIDPANRADRFSIRDLLAEADLSSFLTTYDYEGFGMPPGEAMAMGVPFISTTYELYHEVYGSKGTVAPLWSIDRESSPADPVPASFVEWTMRALTDKGYRAEITARNLEVVRRFFSMDALARQLRELFGDLMD